MKQTNVSEKIFINILLIVVLLVALLGAGILIVKDTIKLNNNNDNNNKNNNLSIVEELDFRLSNDGAYYTLIGPGSYTNPEVVIPEEYKGKPVKEINLLYNFDSITSLTIPGSVETIADHSFYDYTTLKELNLGNGIKRIGEFAFNNTNIFSLYLPESIEEIGDYSFQNCNLRSLIASCNVDLGSFSVNSFGGNPLAEVRTNDEVQRCDRLANNAMITMKYNDYGYLYCETGYESKIIIDDEGFAVYCDGDKKILVTYFGNKVDIEIPSYITEINGLAFANTEVSRVVIPETIEKINDFAFSKAYYLFEILNNSDIEIDDNYRCEYITTIINKEDNKTSSLTIDEDGFVIYNDGTDIMLVNYIADEKTVIVPEGITSMYAGAFASDHSNMLKLVLPDSLVTYVTNSENYSLSFFGGIKNLVSLTIGANSEFLPLDDLSGVLNLSVVINKSSHDYEYASFTEWGSGSEYTQVFNRETEYEILFSIDKNGFIFYNDGENKILTRYIGSERKISIPEGVTKIDGAAFAETKVYEIKIPDTVTEIGNGAFSSCYSLKNIEIPKNIKKIDGAAFYSCVNLESIDLSNVTSIGEYCFENCYDLASIKFSDDLTEIGLCAFNYCCSLTSVKIPDKVTELKAGVFAECENLESIEIGKGVKKLDYSVFASTKITSIFIPSNVNIIDQDAFSSMNELTSIEFEITEGWFKCYYDEWEGTAEYTEVDIDMTNLDEILQMFEALPYGYCLTQGKVF